MARRLTSKDTLYNGNGANATTIILTYHDTLISRHGPAALHAYLKSRQPGLSESMLSSLAESPDTSWEYHRSGGSHRFVFYDEAHAAKNENLHINILGRWPAPNLAAWSRHLPSTAASTTFDGSFRLIEPSGDGASPF